MATAVRLTLKLYRFEIATALLASIALVVAALVAARLLDDVGVPVACFAMSGPDPTPVPAACPALLETWSGIGRIGVRVSLLLGLLPIGVGLILGAPLMARELERGTAALPWTLSGSRRRWLLSRMTILAVVLLAALIPAALAADRLEAAWSPFVDPARSFLDDNYRGAIVVARGLATFGGALLAGLVLGRQLPALIVGFAAAAVMVSGGLFVMDRWYAAAAIYRVADGGSTAGDRTLDLRLRAPDGQILTYPEAAALQPPQPDLPPGAINGDWISEHFTQVWLLVPGSRYPDAAALQSGLMVAGGGLSALASLVLVRRRRPS